MVSRTVTLLFPPPGLFYIARLPRAGGASTSHSGSVPTDERRETPRFAPGSHAGHRQQVSTLSKRSEHSTDRSQPVQPDATTNCGDATGPPFHGERVSGRETAETKI